MTSPDQKPELPNRGLAYVTREMVNGARFLAYRNSEAVARHEVTLLHNPRKARTASLMVGMVIAMVFTAGGLVLSFFNRLVRSANRALWPTGPRAQST